MDPSSSASTRLSVSIVLHHSPPELVRQTVVSLQRAAACAIEAGVLADVSLAVIDNSLSDAYHREISHGLQAWLAPGSLGWHCEQAPLNGGYGAGHNAAIAQVDSNYHLILNPDVELDPTALCRGISALETDDSLVMLSPEVRAEDGRQEFLCKRYPSVLVLLLRAFAPAFVQRFFSRQLNRYEMRDRCVGGATVDVLLASGCFMLARTTALQAVGGFKDDYFLYFEDFDLSMRLASQGRLVFYPPMRILHHGGYAARKGGKHLQYFIRSGCRFFQDYGWRWI